MQESLDKIDSRILKALAADARLPVSQIADMAGLSQSACTRRIQSLEQRGAIVGYTAQLDSRKLGWPVTALVDITLNTQAEDVLRRFENAVGDIAGVTECSLISGAHDYRLKILCRDLDDYERIHREHLGKLPGVATIGSSFVLRSVQTRPPHDAILAEP
jgi:DNA-binding Lrp family transcriptional regulator